MEQVEIEGLRIAYERAGAGPPLVLVHGLVGDGRSTWQRLFDDLSDEFTVVAWDGPGAGRSADPPASFRLPDYADCLAGFVNALNLTSPHVAGLSFGGALALELYHLAEGDPAIVGLRYSSTHAGGVDCWALWEKGTTAMHTHSLAPVDLTSPALRDAATVLNVTLPDPPPATSLPSGMPEPW